MFLFHAFRFNLIFVLILSEILIKETSNILIPRKSRIVVHRKGNDQRFSLFQQLFVETVNNRRPIDEQFVTPVDHRNPKGFSEQLSVLLQNTPNTHSTNKADYWPHFILGLVTNGFRSKSFRENIGLKQLYLSTHSDTGNEKTRNSFVIKLGSIVGKNKQKLVARTFVIGDIPLTNVSFTNDEIAEIVYRSSNGSVQIPNIDGKILHIPLAFDGGVFKLYVKDMQLSRTVTEINEVNEKKDAFISVMADEESDDYSFEALMLDFMKSESVSSASSLFNYIVKSVSSFKQEKEITKSAAIGFIAGAFAGRLNANNDFTIYNEQNSVFGHLDLVVAFSDSRPSLIFEITVNESAEKALNSSKNKGISAKWKSLSNKNIVFGVNYDPINKTCSFVTETISVKKPKGLFNVILNWVESTTNLDDFLSGVNFLKQSIRNELLSEYYSFGEQYNSNDFVKFIAGQFIASEFEGDKFYRMDNIGNCSYFLLSLNEKLIVLKVGDIFVPIEHLINQIDSAKKLNENEVIVDISLQLLRSEKIDSNILNKVEVKYFSFEQISARRVIVNEIDYNWTLSTINTTINVNYFWETSDSRRIMFVDDLNDVIRVFSEDNEYFLNTASNLKSLIHGLLLGKPKNSDETVIVNINVMKSGFTTTDLEARRLILRNDSLFTELYCQLGIRFANNGDELQSFVENAKLQMEKHKVNNEAYSFATRVTQQMFVWDKTSKTVHNSFLEFREVATQSEGLTMHFDEECNDDAQLLYLPCYFDKSKKVVKGVKVLEKFSNMAKEERTEYLDWVDSQKVIGPKSEKIEEMSNLRKAEKLLKKANKIPVKSESNKGLKFVKSGFKYFKKSSQSLKIFRKVGEGATKAMKPLKSVGKAIYKHGGKGVSVVNIVFSGTRLVSDIIELKDVDDQTERKEKIASIVIDGVTIAVDIAMVVLKIVNTALASSVGGPVSLTISAVTVISTGIYRGVKRVNDIENQIGELSVAYKIGEGFRGFFGFDASEYIQHLMRERKLLIQIEAEKKELQIMNYELALNQSSLLAEDVVNFLIENNEFDAKVIPSQQTKYLPVRNTGKCEKYKRYETGCCKTVWKVFSIGVCFAFCEKYKECTDYKHDRDKADWDDPTIPEVVVERIGFNRFKETAKNQGGYDNEGKVIQDNDYFFKIMENSIVLIDEMMNYIRSPKPFQSNLKKGSSKLCFPFKTISKYSNDSSYYCKNALGISYSLNRSQLTSTLIDLEEGNDFAIGRSDHSNTFIIREGIKFMEGGQADDVFVLVGDDIKGRFVGNGGNNILNIQHYKPNSNKVLIVQRKGPLNNEELEQTTNVDVIDMTTVVGRSGKSDHLHCSCDVKQVLLGGGSIHAPDLVSIADPISSSLSSHINIDRDCGYDLNVNVERNTRVNSFARNGTIVFMFPNLQNTSSLRDIHCDYSNYSAIEIILAFEYSFSDLTSFAVNVVNNKFKSEKHFLFKLKFGGNEDTVRIMEVTNSVRKARFFLKDKSSLMINERMDLNYYYKSNSSDFFDHFAHKRVSNYLGFTLFIENEPKKQFLIFNVKRNKKCDKIVNMFMNEYLETIVAENNTSASDCSIDIELKNYLNINNYAEFGTYNYLISEQRLKTQNQSIYIQTPTTTNHLHFNISLSTIKEVSVKNVEINNREIVFKVFDHQFLVKQFSVTTEFKERVSFHFGNDAFMNILNENLIYFFQKLQLLRNLKVENYMQISRRLNATLFLDDINNGIFYVVNNYENNRKDSILNTVIIGPSNSSNDLGFSDRKAIISLTDTTKFEVLTVSESFEISIRNNSLFKSRISIREISLNATAQHFIAIDLSITDLSEITDIVEMGGEVYNHSETVIKSVESVEVIVHEYFHKHSKIQYMLNNGYLIRCGHQLYAFSKVLDFSDDLLKLGPNITIILEVQSLQQLSYISRPQQNKCKQSTAFLITSANETTVNSNEVDVVNDLLCSNNLQVEFNEKLQLLNSGSDGYFVYKWTNNETFANSINFTIEIVSPKRYVSHNFYFNETRQKKVMFKIMDAVSNITNILEIDGDVILIKDNFKEIVSNFKLDLNLEFNVTNTAKYGSFSYFINENNAKSQFGEFHVVYTSEVVVSNENNNIPVNENEKMVRYDSEAKTNSSDKEIETLTFCNPDEDEYANHKFHFDFELRDIEAIDVRFELMKIETTFSFTSKANKEIIEKVTSISFKRFISASQDKLSYNKIVIYYRNDSLESSAKFELTAYSKKENYILFNISTAFYANDIIEVTVNETFNFETVLKVLEYRLSNTLDMEYFETSVDDKLTIALILYELSPLFTNFPHLKLDPSNKVKITEETDTSFGCLRSNARFFFGRNAEFVRNGVDYHILQTVSENAMDIDEIVRDYSSLANKLNALIFVELQPSGDIVVVAQSSNSIIGNKPAVRTHLIGNNGENIFLILPRNDNKTTEIIVYGYTRDDKLSDCIDLRKLNVSQSDVKLKQDAVDLTMDVVKDGSIIASIKLKDIFQKTWFASLSVKFDETTPKILHFNGNKKFEKNDALKRVKKSSNDECENCSTSNSLEEEDVFSEDDVDSLNESESIWSFTSKPIVFDSEESNVLIVSAEEVANNSAIVVNENYEKFDFMRLNDSLVITNMFKIDMLYEASQISYIIVKDFYKTEVLQTLDVSFANNEKDVKVSEVQEVPLFEEALKELEIQVYGAAPESLDFKFPVTITCLVALFLIVAIVLFVTLRFRRYKSYSVVKDMQLKSFNEKYFQQKELLN